MFKSRADANVVYKCTVRLLEELDVLECEFQVCLKCTYYGKCDIDFFFRWCVLHTKNKQWSIDCTVALCRREYY